jgi:uncharacterized damage-inducible protein DinB
MTTDPTDGLRNLLFSDLDAELDGTRRVLERVPGDRLAWKPHERSMSLGELATHVANLPLWPSMILQEDDLDLSRPMPPLEALTSTEGMLEKFASTSSLLRDRLAGMGDSDLLGPWVLRNGDRVLMEMSRASAVRYWGMNHIIHHRGQLTVYLRQLEVPLPPLYGPTADERPRM